MDNEVNGGGDARDGKKKENWKGICSECGILRLELECAFGCELIMAKLKKGKT